MKEQFKDIAFRDKSLDTIKTANSIITEYLRQGLKLTLRQLYYQFVSRDLIPNPEKSYRALGSTINDGRMAGLIDWAAIEDRHREPITPPEFTGLKQLTVAALHAYRLPRWEGQDNYVELWVEKAALAGVLEPLSHEFHVTLMVNRGYSSASAMYESAQRFIAHAEDRPSFLFYLGDHDPSGEDMVRDVRDRLELFGVQDLTVEKVALTMEQVREHKPPPNPAKMTDSRAAGYVAQHGRSSWEVDALNPTTLARVIRGAFENVVDVDKMEAVKAREERDKKRLIEAVEHLEDNEAEDDDNG